MQECGTFTYELVKKKVKNITIRITKEGTVRVTMPLRGSENHAKRFVESRSGWIEEKLAQMSQKTMLHVDEQVWNDEKKRYLEDMTARIFPYFQKYQIPYPEIKYRRMVSRYGSCQTLKGVITYNKILTELPKECAEYVVAHELAHLAVPNHGKGFYQVLQDVMPDYKIREKRLLQYALCH